VKLTRDDVDARIRTKAIAAGGLRALADQWGIPYTTVKAALNRERNPSPRVLEKLRLRRETSKTVIFVEY